MEEIDKFTIERAGRGNKEAFKAIYDHYSPFIWRVLFKMVSGDQNLAQELLQDTFVKIHSSLKSFRSESSFSTWAYRVAYNVAIHSITFQKKRAWLPYDEKLESRNRTDSYDDRELIKKLLKNLSPQERFILIAKEIDDFSYEEISEITKQSTGALRTKLHRIKEHLREQSDKILSGGCVHA